MQQLHPDRIDSVTISGGNSLPMTLFSRYALEPTKRCVAHRMVGLFINGNTRIKVLEERGFDVNAIPREVIR
jgi:hypothetical protein